MKLGAEIQSIRRLGPLVTVIALATLATSALPAAADDLAKARRLVFRWDVPRDVTALTHGGHVPIVLFPPGIPSLAGTAAERQLVLAVTLRNEKDEIVGVATELETFTPPYDARMTHDTVWTLLIPGRGGLVAHEIEESDSEALAFFESLEKATEPWTGSFETRSTIGPAENGMGIIVGGTGEFEGARGFMVEENHYRSFDLAAKTVDVRNTLTFFLTGTEPKRD